MITNQKIVVNQQHPRANDRGPGTEEEPLFTIQAAAERAKPGDIILVHEGVYREEVAPLRGGEEGRPVTYMAAPDEQVFIKGSDRYQGEWVETEFERIYSADISSISETGYNPFAVPLLDKLKEYTDNFTGSAPHTLGQVFLDGDMMEEVSRMEDLTAMPGTWLAVEHGKRIYVHFPVGVSNPSNHLVELTVRKAVFRPKQRGLGYITLKGFKLEHAANQAITTFWGNGSAPQQGLVSCRSGHHWIVEGNSIRWAKSIGIDVGSERKVGVDLEGDPTPGYVGYHLIRNNVISDNGEGGLCGIGHIGTVIQGNTFERNNNLGSISWEDAAIKTHFYINGVIEGNLIRDNYCNGVWIDNVYQNVRITRNVILGNKGAGIFCEMGGSVLIDNNIIGHSLVGNRGIGGNGLYAHDAGGITAVHNLFIQNMKYGVCMTFANEREFNVYPDDMESFNEQPIDVLPCDCSNSKIYNNLFIGNGGAINLPFPSPRAKNNDSDCNIYCGSEGLLSFFVNNKSGVSLDVMAEAFRDKSGENDSEDPNNTMLQYGDGYMLLLKKWRQFMNMDNHSASLDIGNMSWQLLHPGQEAWAAFLLKEDLEKFPCKLVEGLDFDFLGNPISDEHRIPGPFQLIGKKGGYQIRLWPIRGRS